MRHALHELVGDVAHLEGREDEHVRLAGDLAARRLAGPDARNDGRIGLQFAVDRERRVHLLGQFGSADHFVNHFVLGRSFRRKA